MDPFLCWGESRRSLEVSASCPVASHTPTPRRASVRVAWGRAAALLRQSTSGRHAGRGGWPARGTRVAGARGGRASGTWTRPDSARPDRDSGGDVRGGWEKLETEESTRLTTSPTTRTNLPRTSGGFSKIHGGWRTRTLSTAPDLKRLLNYLILLR